MFFYTRYLDDIFIIAASHLSGVHIASLLDGWHDSIHVTHESSQNGGVVEFLDLRISFEPCFSESAGNSIPDLCLGSSDVSCFVCLNWEAYFKPPNNYLYVPWASLHSKAIKRSIIKTQLHRLRYTNKHDHSFALHWQFVSNKLRLRGYPVIELNACYDNFLRDGSLNRVKADYTIPFKFNYFVGAQRIPFSESLEQGLSVLNDGFEQVGGDTCLYRYRGKIFRFVICMFANNTQFVKRYARFRQAQFGAVIRTG